MVLFNVKEDNTEKTIAIAIARAKELKTDLVAATTTGKTAQKLVEMAKAEQFEGKVVIVTHCYGSRNPGENIMPEETRRELSEKGAILVTAAHALSGGERGLSGAFKGVYPLELVAHTLRMISAGTKVCVEIGMMAMDAGILTYKKPVVCIGGTGGGADTACVVTPSYSAKILETRINEFLCKPDLYEA